VTVAVNVTDCPTDGAVGLKVKLTVNGRAEIVMDAILEALDPFASVAVALTV
jgi:hypothetical protein